MNTLIQYFADKFSAALRFFRRPPAKMVVEPPTAGTMNWLSPPSGAVRSWDEVFGARSDAADGVSDPAKNPLN